MHGFDFNKVSSTVTHVTFNTVISNLTYTDMFSTHYFLKKHAQT